MDSRELLVLLDMMPEESEYKRARDGYAYGVERDWTKAEYRHARLITEIAVQGGTFDPEGLVGPVEQAIVDMKARGQWPPAWWPEAVKAEVLTGQADQAKQVQDVTDLRAVSSRIADQLHGRS